MKHRENMNEIGCRAYHVDATKVFSSAGLSLRVDAEMNEHTYEVDMATPENNWLHAAFLGFQELQKRMTVKDRTKRVNTFVTIGTGSGVDAIGAFEIFHPRKIIATDIHRGVLFVAERNIRKYIKNPTEVHVWEGNLAEPLRQHGVVADVIYANLPNIPSYGGGSLYNEQRSASFHAPIPVSVPKEAERYLLSLQYALLHDAYRSLVPGGSLVVSIGGRVPVALVEDMFAEAGYAYEELVVLMKAQSQPEVVLRSYSEAEKEHGVEFDFYLLDEATSFLKRHGSVPTATEEMKKVLAGCRITATQAWILFQKEHKNIGHVVQVLHGIRN